MIRNPRCLRLAHHAFELWIACGALFAAVTYLTGVGGISSRTVEVVSPALAFVYSVLYGTGGVLVIVGLWRGSPRLEGAGLALIAAGVVAAACGLLAVLGSGIGVTTALLQAGAALACAVRIKMLARGGA